jgi:hypothetical protein
MSRFSIPKHQRLLGNTIYVISTTFGLSVIIVTVLILVMPERNMMNPEIVLEEIFNGASLQQIWLISDLSELPENHYYVKNLGLIDNFAMLIILFGSTLSLLVLIPLTIYLVFIQKDYLYAIFCTVIVMLFVLSLFGILKI